MILSYFLNLRALPAVFFRGLLVGKPKGDALLTTANVEADREGDGGGSHKDSRDTSQITSIRWYCATTFFGRLFFKTSTTILEQVFGGRENTPFDSAAFAAIGFPQWSEHWKNEKYYHIEQSMSDLLEFIVRMILFSSKQREKRKKLWIFTLREQFYIRGFVGFAVRKGFYFVDAESEFKRGSLWEMQSQLWRGKSTTSAHSHRLQWFCRPFTETGRSTSRLC